MAKTKKRKKVLVIHGPNLHLLGKRETNIYGAHTLKKINEELIKEANKAGWDIDIFQSNSEGGIVSKITGDKFNALLINPAAYTHTSVAIRDAVLAVKKPTVEVHLSNIFKREHFRKKSLISDVADGIITGFGKDSYILAMKAITNL